MGPKGESFGRVFFENADFVEKYFLGALGFGTDVGL
jgi:hypothetical protein